MTTTSGFELLPAIDLRNGRVVRLQQGDFARETTFSNDPVAVAEGFVRDGARWLHVVDLDAARTGAPEHGSVIAAIVAAIGGRAKIEVAGGLRDERSVEDMLAAGVSRVVIGTRAIMEPAFAGRLVSIHGADRIVAAVDVRAGLAVGHGWRAGTRGRDASATIQALAGVGIATFEVTAIERDGLLDGPDLSLYERLVHGARGSVIASGGVVTIADLAALRDIGCSGAIVGRALYEGRIVLTDALGMGHASG